jgi:MFS family permease
MIMVIAPIAGRLADRIGPRPLMTGGLTTVAIALLWMTGITTHSSYGFLIVSFVLMGIGMGFVMSPMSTAAMNSVDPAKAGVASGVLSMTRMVGSTFGVAVIGAIIATLGRDRLTTLLPQIPAGERTRLVSALGSGAQGTDLPAHVQTALSQTYVYALSNALYVAGGLALLGALLAWILVAPAPRPVDGQPAEWEPAAGESTERGAAAEPIHA